MLITAILAVALTCAFATASGTGSASHLTDSEDSAAPRTGHMQLLEQPGGNTSHNLIGNNWAGAVYHGYKTGSLRHVSATVVVPGAVKLPAGGDTTTAYSGSAWVGIDGFSGCSNSSILQTGVQWVLQGGQVTYRAWYEWFPARSIFFPPSFVIHAGDTLRFTVDTGTPTTGVATVDNLTSGKSVSQALNSTVALCAADAEWIVEDQSINGTLLPFANFGSVTFSDATVIVNAGAGGSLGPVYASLLDIQQGSLLTQSTSTDTKVKVNYIG